MPQTKTLTPNPDQELIGSSCPRVRAPSPLEFARDFVHQNRPCIITGERQHPPDRASQLLHHDEEASRRVARLGSGLRLYQVWNLKFGDKGPPSLNL